MKNIRNLILHATKKDPYTKVVGRRTLVKLLRPSVRDTLRNTNGYGL